MFVAAARRALVTVLSLALLAAAPAPSTPRHSPILSASAVASPDRFGADAARDVLQAGGNAVDAAVATAFALAVTYPEAGNLGGGGFMTLWVDSKPYFLDYRETAPAKASAHMYLDAKGQPIVDLSLTGNLAAGTPGTVAGLWEAHRRFGRLPWARDLAPALRLAREGFVVPKDLAAGRDFERTRLARTTNFDRYFGSMQAGRRFRQPQLAATLQRISEQGPRAFYRGKTADFIVAQMNRGPVKGLISKADLAAYRPVWRAPIEAPWRDFTVVTAPPPSSGGIALLQLLDMRQDLDPRFKGLTLNSPQYVHLVAEMEKRVFADRAQYLGDPGFADVPVSHLIDPAYIARRAAEVDPDKPSALQAVQPGLEKPQTIHFSVIDRWGNAVSNTYTLNGPFGAGVVVEGAGFLLNDEMDDFSVKPGAPNQFGVVGGDANAVAPGKRPLSSMTPTLLVKDGRVAMVIGTPGGSRIFTSVFQVLEDVYDFGMSLPAALEAPRFHHQLLPVNTIYYEPYAPLPADLITALKARGYRVENQGWTGDIQAIQIKDGAPLPASDPRARGVSLVVRNLKSARGPAAPGG